MAQAVSAGDDVLYVQEELNWEVGQEIILLTSSWFDCPSDYQEEWCKPCYSWQTCNSEAHQNERRRIVSVDNAQDPVRVQVDAAFVYGHFASMEYQTEVMLVSRNIVMEGYGTEDGEEFGGHSIISNGEGRFAGVLARNMGQKNVLGRYPFHFHLIGDGNASYFEDCSVDSSFFRGYVIHGTNFSRASRNVAYNVWGMVRVVCCLFVFWCIHSGHA